MNQTHLNIIKGTTRLTKKKMDNIYSAFQGRVKIIFQLNYSSMIYPEPNTPSQKEKNYKKQIYDKINEFKDHPSILAWYVNDENLMNIIKK